MGQFSFKTTDTELSIYSTEGRNKRPVEMVDHEGNRWLEDGYEGYGRFGGKDIYALIAEMNDLVEPHMVTDDDKRTVAIYAHFEDAAHQLRYPNLNHEPGLPWHNAPLVSCPDQGWFFEEDDWAFDDE